MTALQQLLNTYRQTAKTEREKGTYFEELVLCYLRNEASYRDLYSQVWTYADWAEEQGIDKRDTGIDLVAKTSGTGEYHAFSASCTRKTTRYRRRISTAFSPHPARSPLPTDHRQQYESLERAR
jgi:predicted helicase